MAATSTSRSCTIPATFSAPASCSSIYSPAISLISTHNTTTTDYVLYRLQNATIATITTTQGTNTKRLTSTIFNNPGEEPCIPQGGECGWLFTSAICPRGYKALGTVIGNGYTTEYCCPE